jgi:hypothetical protein
VPVPCLAPYRAWHGTAHRVEVAIGADGLASAPSSGAAAAAPPAGAADSRFTVRKLCARLQEFVRRSTYVPLRKIFGEVRREFMHHIFVALLGTLDPIFVMPC